ncbi:MAG: type I-C CRISPR-associated protein Cas8c/Csd1 [Patescibacteria group bacterium]
MFLRAATKFAVQRGLGNRPGYETMSLGYALVLDAGGNLLRTETYALKGDERPFTQVPKLPGPRTRNARANPFCDNATYVLGLWEKEDKKDRAAECFGLFVDLVNYFAEASNNVGAQAVAKFYAGWEQQRPRLEQEGALAWKIAPMIAFIVDGQYVHEQAELVPYFDAWRVANRPECKQAVRCVLTGEFTDAPQELHDSVVMPGADGKLASASLVSYNLPHLLRYGGARGAAAPMSPEGIAQYRATFAYLAENRFFISLDTSRMYYWLDGDLETLRRVQTTIQQLELENAEEETEATPEDYSQLDHVRGKELRHDLTNAAQHTDLDTKNYSPFFLVSLSANMKRAMVKQYTSTVAEVIGNVRKYRNDLAMGDGKMTWLPTVYELTRAMADRRKVDRTKIDAQMARYKESLWNCALQGLPLPVGMRNAATLAASMIYVRNDRRAGNTRFSLLAKLVKLGRNRTDAQEVSSMLELENKNPSYLWGRAFAILEQVKYCQYRGKTGMNVVQAELRRSAWLANAFQQAATAQRNAWVKLVTEINGHVQREAHQNSGHLVDHYLEILTEVNAEITRDNALPLHADLTARENFILGVEHQRQQFNANIASRMQTKKEADAEE